MKKAIYIFIIIAVTSSVIGTPLLIYIKPSSAKVVLFAGTIEVFLSLLFAFIYFKNKDKLRRLRNKVKLS